jgi:DNA-binding beta-propeller fold protein YncE
MIMQIKPRVLAHMSHRFSTATKIGKTCGLSLCLLSIVFIGRVDALDILHFIEARDYARVMEDASGLKITDDGVVYVTSTEKGTLLKITDGKIEAISLSPSPFKDQDLGGLDVLANGQLVIVTEDDGQVGILDPDLKLKTLFSQSGSDAGELNSPGPVAASINNNIYVGDVKNRQVSVFNHQGLFLHSFGKHGSSSVDLRKPTHVSIDAEENVYVLEGPDRISIFNVNGELIARFSARDLKQYFGDTPEFGAMTADLDGTLYIGDNVESRVTVFDWRNLKVLAQFGSLGQSRAQYRDISYISVNARGQIAVLDNKNKKVEVYQLEQTSFATPVATDLLQHGLTIEADCVAQAAFIDDQTLCIRPKNQGVVILAADGSEQGAFAEGTKKPSAMYVGPQSVAVLGKNSLHAFAHDGRNLFSIGRYGSSAGGFNNPNDVFIQGGNYYVADKGNNRVQVFGPDGLFLEEIRAGKGDQRLFIEVGPIAVDSKENLYIADGSALGLIHVISKDRKKVASITSTGRTGCTCLPVPVSAMPGSRYTAISNPTRRLRRPAETARWSISRKRPPCRCCRARATVFTSTMPTSGKLFASICWNTRMPRLRLILPPTVKP